MDAIEAIRSRQSKPRVSDERPPREQIEELLALAVRAPTHHLTNPWRFYVLAGDERERMANAIAAAAVDAGTAPDAARADGIQKSLRAPVIIVVTTTPLNGPKVVEQEEHQAVAMAMQNMLIAAHALGLGAMLRTGPTAYHSAIRKELGLAPNEVVSGFVYVGYPDRDREPTPRTPAPELTTWLGWE